MEEALLIASAFKQDHKTRIIVKKNRYEAQQFYQQLSPLLEDVLLFVMEESLRIQALASSPEDSEEMVSTLTECVLEDKPRIIICNTAGFLRFLPDKQLFQSSCIRLKTDMELKMKALKQMLVRSGYIKVNYVNRPCTFAARGGIVDVFSLQYDHPIRIEFFDTVVESIRFFDEKTQRTIESIEQAVIGPASDILFTDEQIQTIKERVNEKLRKEIKHHANEENEVLKENIEKDIRAIENYDNDAYLYCYYSYISNAHITDYISGQVIFSSKEEVVSYAEKLNEDHTSFMQEMVLDLRSLPQYRLFHDIDSHKNSLYFHDFLDMKNPIVSEMYPLEKASLPLIDQLKEIQAKQIYFSVGKEERFKLESVLHMFDFSYEFIENDFYEGFSYQNFAVYTAKELFIKKVIHKRYKKTFKEGQILESVLELNTGDYVVHERYGIGQYAGIVQKEVQGQILDYLRIFYAGEDELFVPLSNFQWVRKYISKEGIGIRLSQLGSDKWEKTKTRVNKKVEEIAEKLVDLYAHRNENIGFAYPKDDAFQREFEQAFEYEPTWDQIQATREIKAEMEKPKPMDHLLCGDVGFGKTEVAMRIAFKAITNGKQVAFLCPTTILSMQHYRSLSKRFEYTGANIALVNRFLSTKEIKDIQKGLENGIIDIVIGTHKLLNVKFRYKDLGLLIIDEEQRFGVTHKEKIKEMKESVDVLALSATPIPRTLQMSLIGVRTISQLNTPPAQRHAVQTYVMEKRTSIIQEIIERELARDGQVFYLYNNISNIYEVAQKIQNQFPEHSVAVAHGHMSRREIEQTMIDFSEQKYQILVCTTIIETGLDIANANTMIIENADRFGLAQLYQIRGRVGRRQRIAYCYLMVQPQKQLTEEATKRLKSIREFTQLGSGYKIAMRDLTIRGAGDLLGPQQAGFIDQIGLDMYLEMLTTAIKKKRGEPVETAKEEKTAQISMNGHIPSGFTENDGDKLSLYQDIKKVRNLKELLAYEKRIEDLYGHIPSVVKQLFERRRIDLFVNLPGVDSLVEGKQRLVLTMDKEWTSHCNGIELFRAMNTISRNIHLQLKNGNIVISILHNRQVYDVLKQVMQEIETNGEIYEAR